MCVIKYWYMMREIQENEQPRAGDKLVGFVVKRLRERAGIGLPEASGILGIEESLLRDIEAEVGRVPRTVEFYTNFTHIPGVEEFTTKLVLRSLGVPAEIYPQVLPNYELLRMSDGSNIAVFQEPRASDDEKKNVRNMMRWGYEESK